ncbi:MAG: DUF2279 domain-containing protein [Bacteroidota bacterium]
MAISTRIKSGLLAVILLSTALHSKAQQADTLATVEGAGYINKTRLTGLVTGGSLTYAGTMVGLYQMWYKDYPQSSFHFINDNKEWLQVDKLGHGTTAFNISRMVYESFRWTGMDNQKSAWYGGSVGFLYLTVIEILDGFSAEWGASGGDLIANTIGSAAFVSQQLYWNEQRILIKWSARRTGFARYRPDQMGSTFAERMLKDYNGQTYWLSANVHAFLKKESRFPGWLNVAVGYGAEGMTGGASNPSEIEGVPIPSFDRYRQFYFAPDIDLSKVRTESKVLRSFFKYLGFFKFPMPTLEFSKKGVQVHALFF